MSLVEAQNAVLNHKAEHVLKVLPGEDLLGVQGTDQGRFISYYQKLIRATSTYERPFMVLSRRYCRRHLIPSIDLW